MKGTIVTGSLIVFSDGFVWKRLSNEKAYKIWVSAENEEREIRNFLERVKEDPVDVDWKTEGFYWYNNANNTPGECADFIFYKRND